LARAAFDAENSRYDSAETKATRYVTVLALLLTAAAIKGEDLLWTGRHTTAARAWVFAFSSAYLVTFATGFIALWIALRAMTVENVPAIPLDDQLPALFRDHQRIDALKAMAKSFFTEAATLRATNERRSNTLKHVYWLLRVTLGAAVASLILYAVLSFR